MGFIFGGGKKQAAAITKASDLESSAAREAARGSQMTQETLLAQDKASHSAAELLSKPQGEVQVDLIGRGRNADQFDPATGKRRTTRSTYSSAIQI